MLNNINYLLYLFYLLNTGIRNNVFKLKNDFFEWLKNMDPGEETRIVFKYKVEYPKDKYISGLY